MHALSSSFVSFLDALGLPCVCSTLEVWDRENRAGPPIPNTFSHDMPHPPPADAQVSTLVAKGLDDKDVYIGE